MNHNEVKDFILQEKFIVLYRGVTVDKMGRAAEALLRGGVKILEVTFDQTASDPIGAFKMQIDKIKEAVGNNMLLGSGTCLTEEQVQATYDAGAKFVISPNVDQDVIKKAKSLGLVVIPGAMTPTEIVQAWKLGADIVKLFPADDLGYHYIWNIRGPLKHIPLFCTGGVNIETIPEFLKSGASGVGTGVSVMKKELLAVNDFVGIEKLAKAHIDAIKKTCEELGI